MRCISHLQQTGIGSRFLEVGGAQFTGTKRLGTMKKGRAERVLFVEPTYAVASFRISELGLIGDLSG